VSTAASNRVCVVSHDAGGAEILANYVAQNNVDYRLVLEGPAVGVFQRRLGPNKSWSLAQALAGCDWCLTGTGWQSDLEWRAVGEAKQIGLRTVAFLDHWVNYPERFERNGVVHLPDEIWVGDEEAQALARKHFPGVTVELVPNPYFAHVAREIEACKRERPSEPSEGGKVLFVCENISGHAQLRHGDARYWGYTEFDALEYFFSRIQDLGMRIEQVTLRPHPSDPPRKYEDVIARHAPLARLGGSKSLIQEIVDADVVAGCESMALIPAILANKRVLCAVPPGNKVTFIDKKRGVEMLRDLPARRHHALG
jgi:hypothetical protein